jgi:crotonobetainyl-CoA:carnitine CoA-transferase CaiB-like acyl-CoA transferase
MDPRRRPGKLEKPMIETNGAQSTGPLRGLRVFDLTRVLAGPTCAQMLADLGADVIKIERPGAGDDTRGFAPPYMPGTKESAYFVGVNRNKRSVTLDIAQPEGQAIALSLIAQCDILVENFKVGALPKYGLGYDALHAKFPRLIYCSITGFGQTGPYASRPGYDSLIQAMGGVMSLTDCRRRSACQLPICSPDCMAASAFLRRCGIAMRRGRGSRSISACSIRMWRGWRTRA